MKARLVETGIKSPLYFHILDPPFSGPSTSQTQGIIPTDEKLSLDDHIVSWMSI